MRSELTILEQIDMYLSGKLSPAEKTAFEQRIANNPDLANQVMQQKELIRAVNRKALRAQINTVAAAGGGGAAGGGFSNLFMGIGGVVAVGVATTAIIYFSSEKEHTPAPDLVVQHQEGNSNHEIAGITDTTAYYETDENLILEQPETIFSSMKNYEEEVEEDRVNVTVKFQWGGQGQTTDLQQENNGGIIDSDPVREVPDSDYEEAQTVEVVSLEARAKFPGGNIAMDNFIDRNLYYPKSAHNKSIEGVVRCDFQVTADGIISNIDAKCIKMNEVDGPAFNEMRQLMNKKIENAFINNATHILRTMPEWEPAKDSQGNPTLSFQRMYFNYDMGRGCLVYQLDEGTGVSIHSIDTGPQEVSKKQ